MVLLLLATAVVRRSPVPLVAAVAAWSLARRARPPGSAAPSDEGDALRRELDAARAHAAGEAEQQVRMSARLRHDVRGALSPALLVADRLAMSAEPDKQRAGELISRSVNRAVELLRKPTDP